MGTAAILNAFAYVDSHDFTGDANDFGLTCEGEMKEKTNFRSGGWREYHLGLKTSALNLSGFYQAGADTVDEYAFAALGTGGKVTTCGVNEVEGEPCGMFQQMQHEYQWLGEVGEMAPFQLQGGCSDGVGVILGKLVKEQGAVSATGATGTALELGAVAAGKYVYGTFHVLGTPGTTVTAVVESAAASNFAGATTRITFGPYTTAGGRWGARVAGSITDTWWRLRVTAITGTFTIACGVGIQ
jgi:hypothetical protein